MHVTPLAGDGAIVAKARRRHGVVTTADLLQAGFGPNAIAAKVERGWLRRLHRGVYLVGALESPLTKPAAALLATGPDAALSHRTAAVVWELLPPRPADPVHVTLLKANRRSRHGVTLHRTDGPVETRRRHGLRLTSPARTLQELEGTPDYERAHNEALVLRLIPRERHDGMTRSEAERRLLALIRKAGLPLPRTNVKVRGFEVDLYWPEQRLERVIRVTQRQLEGAPERLVARFATGLAAPR